MEREVEGKGKRGIEKRSRSGGMEYRSRSLRVDS